MIRSIACLLLAAGLCAGQTPSPAKPTQPPEQPTLDELLGIPGEKPAGVEPSRGDLERKLTATEVSDQFKQAVQLMGQTAERLAATKDTGLNTQRVQEDIIRKLDQVIKAAEDASKQQKQQRSRSRQQQRQPQQNQPGQQRQEQSTTDPSQDSPDGPPGREAAPNPGVAARGAAWGALPERFRDALVQGNTDKYSSIWQKWTEAYYRRLAEDANK
jgi:hypothetical protein